MGILSGGVAFEQSPGGWEELYGDGGGGWRMELWWEGKILQAERRSQRGAVGKGSS